MWVALKALGAMEKLARAIGLQGVGDLAGRHGLDILAELVELADTWTGKSSDR